MTGEILHLAREWVVGDLIGAGGFGEVYEASGNGEDVAVKFIPQLPGADRELLFVELDNAVNIIPIVDRGEHAGHWVLVMRRGDCSLREHLDDSGGIFDISTSVAILNDIIDALISLAGRVVHRDLKPENVLRLDGKWCLADFGISRYAEATTAPETRKFAMSPPYAAPERWRHERATAASDVYAAGIMAYEMISGLRPFPGPGWDDYRDQHLHEPPPTLTTAPAALSAAIDECLFKAPEARPSSTNLRARLDSVAVTPSGPGLAALVEAEREEVGKRAMIDREQSRKRTDADRRTSLAESGRSLFDRISDELRVTVASAAPSATFERSVPRGWRLSWGSAVLSLSKPRPHSPDAWGRWERPVLDVVLAAELNLRIPPNRSGYEGRSHSLWYCDAALAGEFRWYETAFMVSALIPRRGRQNPFALYPGEESAKALWTGLAEFQLAWPFTPLEPGTLGEFIDRWAAWLANASQGHLSHPGRMPEKDTPERSFRRE